MTERRRYPRYYCSYDADYYTYGLVSLEGRSVAADISRGGIRLSVPRIVKKGNVLKINIYPCGKDYPILARAKVRWVQKVKGDLPFHVDAGIEFISIEPADINKLLHFV